MQNDSGIITEIRYDDPISGYNLPVYLSSGSTYTSSPTNTFSAIFKYNNLYPTWETVSGEHSGND
jgi:predicted HAD superfamily hydrolase